MKKLITLAICVFASFAFAASAGAWSWTVDGEIKGQNFYNQSTYGDFSTNPDNSSFNMFSKGEQYMNMQVGGSITDSSFAVGGGYQSVVTQAQGISRNFEIPGGTAYDFSESASTGWIDIGNGTPPDFGSAPAE